MGINYCTLHILNLEEINKLTESTKTAKDITQELIDNFTVLAEEAEKRRATAGAKFEYYKLEYADGEKHAYQDAAKKLQSALKKYPETT